MASTGRTPAQDNYVSPAVTPATSQYPFPTIDTTQRYQSFTRPNPRRGSTASSVLSASSRADGNSTIVESGRNAISTLLQPPILRTGLQPHNAATSSGFKQPTQKDIPPVALTNIPHIDAKSFHPYLAQVGSLYEAFQRAKNETDGGEAALFHREKKEKAENWEAVLSEKLQRPPHSRQNSVVPSPVTSPAESPRLSRRSSGQRRQAVTPLSTIPAVYSDNDFHLENPRIFDVVSERSEIVKDPNAPPSGRKSLATNAILQEKLSWYMDTVEVHLISSISTASMSFFSALGELQELRAEAEDSVARIQKLRRELARLDKEMAMDGLKVVNLKQRRNNVRLLAEAVLQLEEIVNALRDCQQMVERGEIDTALDSIDGVERLLTGEVSDDRYSPQDLRRIRALDGTLDDLKQLRLQVGRGYESRLHNSLLGDIRRHVAETETSVILQRWGTSFTRLKPGQRRAPSTFATYMNIKPDFRLELEKEMQGLSRARHTTPAVTSFRAMVLREMKVLIKRQLPSSTDDDTMSVMSASTHGRGKTGQDRSSILMRNLRALDAGDWYQMLVKIYTSISESLRRLSIQVKILLDITSALDQPQANIKSPPLDDAEKALGTKTGRGRSLSVQAEMQQALDLSNLLGEAVDAAQTQITKVLRVRSQEINALSLHEFIQYFTLNRLFADECEAISGRSGTSLKSVVDSQIKDYVARFGEGERDRLVQVMDSDRWEPRDFGERESVILSRIVEGSTADVPAWSESSMIWQDPVPTTAATNGSSENKEKVRSAVVDEQRYILTESSLAMLRSVEQFQRLSTGIPGVGQDIASALLECLKLYNSRTNQLILGAGAMRVVGLKTITSKHLALSSQALSFFVALVPYVREFFRRHVPSSTAMQNMTEFDKVKRLFQEHQHGIHEKLADMMCGLASNHVKAMKAIDWETAAKQSDTPISPYMETLTKQTATLQKVLAKYLPEVSVMSIMHPVFESYRKQWETAFRDVDLKSQAAKDRLIADVDHFNSRISKLEGSGDLGPHIVNVVRMLPISSVTESSAGSAAVASEQNERDDMLRSKQSESQSEDANQ